MRLFCNYKESRDITDFDVINEVPSVSESFQNWRHHFGQMLLSNNGSIHAFFCVLLLLGRFVTLFCA